MAPNGLGVFIRRLRTHFSPAEVGGLTDRDLLDRWLSRRDEAAFETLVWRHGPLVLGACRRLLADDHDVEDAFQATFVVLVRKAATIRRREAVGGWLYRVAYRVALRARSASARRVRREGSSAVDPPAAALPDPVWRELQQALDAEVNRLGERERVPFVLCYLEGWTNAEAARELRCPVGTVESRLARARRQLRARLTRRGLAPAAVALAAGAVMPGVTAGVPARLVASVHQTASSSAVPARVAPLATGAVRGMLVAKLNAAAAALLLVGLLGAGTVFAVGRGQQPAAAPVARTAALDVVKRPAPSAVPTAKLLDQAAEAIDDDAKNSGESLRMLQRLGVLRARDGDAKGASEAFTRAEKIIRAEPSLAPPLNPQSSLWRELAKAQAEADEVDAGLLTAASIPGELYEVTVQEMATILSGLGKFKEAMRLADGIKDSDRRDIALMDIARARADFGDIRAALRIADSIKGPAIRVLVLTGNEWSGNEFGTSLMGGIALVQEKTGDRAGARETLRRAVEMAERVPADAGPGRVRAWVARAQARLGDIEAARKTAARLPAEEQNPVVGRTYPRDLAFQEIAVAQAEAGHADDALKTIQDAKLSSYYRIVVLNAVGRARAKAGQRDASSAAFDEAMKLATDAEKQAADKGEAPGTTLYILIATARAEAGDFDGAEKAAAALGGNEAQVRGNLAYYRARSGDFAGALKYLDRVGRDAYSLQAVAQFQTEASGEREALARAAREASPSARAATLLGVVAGRNAKNGPAKR
jgi:RNA polymerase sigma factor (sigma-70 family)